MTYEEFKEEVDFAVSAVLAAQSGILIDMPDVNYSLDACEAASLITGADDTLCRMFNKQFRTDASNFAFEQAKDMIK